MKSSSACAWHCAGASRAGPKPPDDQQRGLSDDALHAAQLRAGKPLHIAQIRLLKLHRVLSPDVGYITQFIERERVDAHAHLAHTTVHGVMAAILRDIVANSLLPASILRQDVDQSHLIKIRGTENAAAEDH